MSNNDNRNIEQPIVHNYLLTQESFERLRQAQQEINKRSDVTPSLRKIVNRMMTEDAINTITQQLIHELS